MVKQKAIPVNVLLGKVQIVGQEKEYGTQM